jgi:Ca-activated chloride channel family protein
MMFHGGSAWFLLLLLVPLAAWRLSVCRRNAAIQFSSPGLRGLDPTWRQRSRWLLPVFRLAALILLIVAMARPQQGLTQRITEAEGIAIQLVLDRSGSMEQDDFRKGGEQVTRLAAVKDVAGRFVAGGGPLPGRLSDLIGLVTFSRFAQSDCPLTLDHEFLLARLEETDVVGNFREDGTAIGDALGLAVAKLHELDERREETERDAVKGKVVVLLTDGENNAGQFAPLEAAELAAALEVRVYTIGVGTDTAPAAGETETQWTGIGRDEQVLRQMARITGGKSYLASDAASLEAIYAEIDRLERSRFDDRRYSDYRELAVEPFRLGPLGFPPLVLAALVLLAVEAVLARTVYRVIP